MIYTCLQPSMQVEILDSHFQRLHQLHGEQVGTVGKVKELWHTSRQFMGFEGDV